LTNLGSKTFWIVALVLSGLWVAAVFGPVLYGTLFPAEDFTAIRQALEQRGAPPPLAAAAVADAVSSSGVMRRSVQVGFFSKITVTLQLGAQHKSRRTQASYIAWFEKLPGPILLLIQRNEEDGSVRSYQIDEGEPRSIVRPVVLPLLVFIFSLYMVCRKSPKIEPAAAAPHDRGGQA